MSISVPLVFIQESYNGVVVKLLVFTALSGLLLLIAGLKLFEEPCFPVIPLLLILPVVILTAVHIYQPSNTGISRILLVGSGLAVYVSVRILRLTARQILLPLLCGGITALIVSFLLPNATNRLYGTFWNANLIGSFAAGLLPAGIGMLKGRGWKRIGFQILISFICIAVIYKSGTRASMLALPAGVAAALLIRRNRRLLIPLACLYGIFVFIILFQGSLHVPDQEGSIGVRQVVWQGSADMFMQKPVFGWGTGSFQLVFPAFRPGNFAGRGMPPNTLHAHSEPLELIAENGMAGFILWAVLLIVLIKGGIEHPRVSGAQWGAVAGVAVLLIEGLVSVALRWTSSFFLLTMLICALPSITHDRIMRIPKWTALIPIALAILLAGPGTCRVYRMTRAVLLYDAALKAMDTSTEVSIDLSLESLKYNSWELESWSLLGYLYVIKAGGTEDAEIRAELLRMQLAVYDSLASRAPDFGLLVLNRSRVHVQLGMWNSAMDDLMHIYRTQYFLKKTVIDTGTRIAALADAEKSFQFMNLLYSNLLVKASGEDSLQNAVKMIDALGITYAMAANHAPGAVERMRRTTDSVLAPLGDSITGEINRVIDKELLLAPEGQRLLTEFNGGLRTGLEQECLSALADSGVYAPYQRWLLCMISAESGTGEFLDIACYHAFLLHDTCYPLGGLFPGGTDIFALLPEISAAGGNPQHQFLLRDCLHRVLEMDAFSLKVKSFLTGAIGACGDDEEPGFRSDNLMQMDRLLHAPGSESPEFRTAAEFTMGCLGIAASGSPESTEESTLGVMRELKHELVQIHGAEDASRIFSNIIAEEMSFLAEGPFPPGAEASALRLRNRLFDLP